MPQYKLTYFDLPGLGESIRYLLSYGRKEFVDNRIPYLPEWAETKKTMPFGKVPVLEIDGQIYSDSCSICRYLGTQFGLVGNDPLENLKIDQKAGALQDLLAECGQAWRAEESEKAKKSERVLNEVLPFYMKRLDKTIEENGGFLANGKLSWVDVYFTAFMELAETAFNKDLTSSFKNITALMQTVRSQPGIQEWIKKRPTKVNI